MKKASLVLLVCVVIALVVSSCAGNKKCPAYSQNNIKTTQIVKS
jgi:hypothetical protein